MTKSLKTFSKEYTESVTSGRPRNCRICSLPKLTRAQIEDALNHFMPPVRIAAWLFRECGYDDIVETSWLYHIKNHQQLDME